MDLNKIPPPPPPPSSPPKPPVKSEKKQKSVNDELRVLRRNLPHNGKVPPQAIDFEKLILGSLISISDGRKEAMDILHEEAFYKIEHVFIFRCIKLLYEDGEAIDLMTVIEKLKNKSYLEKIGGELYIINLASQVTSSAHLDYWCRIVLQKYALREFIKLSSHVIEESYDNDPDIFNILDHIEADLDRINRLAIRTNEKSADAKEMLTEKYADYLAGRPPGIYIGVREFDYWSGGLGNRDLITFAARTGMGKTTIVLSISKYIAIDKEIPVGFFSLEMAEADLLYRIASNLTGITYGKIRKAELTKEQFEEVYYAIDYIKNSNLHIFDTAIHKNYFHNISKKIRELVSSGIKLVIIDYVQLIKMAGNTRDRTSELSDITRDLKALANELNIPIIILAQINRATDGRSGSKIPLLSDLKQSGSIEEDSDMVVFFVRDAYYQQTEGAINLPPRVVGDTQMVIAKGRNVGTNNFRCYLDFFNYKFVSYSDAEF